jgi:hypothetical protein
MNKMSIQPGQRRLALFMIILFLNSIISPTALWAISGGPTQPEFTGFQQVSSSNLVDPFTGDLSYNIPLFDIGGYPINLVYSGGSNMEAEASWVGYGWTLNPGFVNRDVRGLPDDFKGDVVQKQVNIRPNWTAGVSATISAEIFGTGDNPKPDTNANGFPTLSASLTLTYNNYKGIGVEMGANVSTSLAKFGGVGFGGSLGISSGSNGFSTNANLNFKMSSENNSGSVGIGGGFNSRAGLSDMTLNANVSARVNDGVTDKNKTNWTSTSLMSGSLVSFGYTPPFQAPRLKMKNQSYALRATIGGEVFGAHPDLSMRGFYNVQKLQQSEYNDPAFGTLYFEDAPDDAILDYNKEKDIPITTVSSYLPVPYLSSDVYGIMAHGVSGQYRVKRGDNGVVSEQKNNLNVSGLSIGVEVGGGNAFHGGGDVSVPTLNNEWGKWENSNMFSAFAQFTASHDTFQSAYFHNNMELNVFASNETQQAMLAPISATAQNMGEQAMLTGTYTNSKLASDYTSIERIPSRTVLSYLNASEASAVGFQKDILSFPMNVKVLGEINRNQVQSLSRLEHNQNHISELTVTRDDGYRYVFGIPIYNKKKIECTFNIGDSQEDDIYSTYTPNVDNKPGNTIGLDYFLDKTTTPEYATGYLLTTVASPNYVDITGNGISSDDIGDAVYFNYTKVYNNYKWRTPYNTNSVNNSPGLILKDDDSKGSYVYGEKEIWLNHSIESKDQIAFFYASNTDRKDAIEPQDENGGMSNNPRRSYRLDSIQIFSKAEIVAHLSSPTPIKTIVFEYSYNELFTGQPNAIDNSGKQTLSKVYFTYGKNYKGKLNPYAFQYHKHVNNTAQPYAAGATDKWGNIKIENSNGIPLNQFPYAEQDREFADQYARLGMLKEIKLPSGAKISVEYQADDYGIVNNLPACTMQLIAGIGPSNDFSQAGDFLNDISPVGFSPNRFIFIEIDDEVSSRSIFAQKYLDGITGSGKQLYFNFGVDLNHEDKFDRVSGYCDVVDYGISTTGAQRYGWIELKNIREKSKDYNPISMAALQKFRLESPEKAYPGSYINPTEPNVLDVITMLGSSIFNLVDLIVGVYTTTLIQNKCNITDLDKSWIRLKTPSGSKVGGGNRVSKVTISDQLTPGYYKIRSGQTYDYTLWNNSTNESTGKSSGVAAYEPLLGGEENPSRSCLTSVDKVKLAPSNYYYTELPYGEQLFPSPQVGYSEVRVKSFGGEALSERYETGEEIFNFFTSKDFPTYASSSTPYILPALKGPKKLFRINHNTYYTSVQGHSIIVNDMHGKPKSHEIRNKFGALISKEVYKYDVLSPQNAVNFLDNSAKLVDSKGNVTNGYVGIDMEIYQEMNESTTSTSNPGMMGNLDAFMAGPFPITVPVPLNLFSNSTQITRTAAITKFIRKSGVLKSIVKTDENGAVTTTDNLLYDKELGTLVLSSIGESKGNKHYSLNIPAYWAYDKMGPASNNLGLSFSNVLVNSLGIITDNTINMCLKEGDEVLVSQYTTSGTNAAIPEKFYAIKSDAGYKLISRNANQGPVIGYCDIKIIRSGFRNLLQNNVQTIVSKANPYNSSSNRIDLTSLKDTVVIQSSALELTDYNLIDCQKQAVYNCDFDPRSLGITDVPFGYLIDAIIHYYRFGSDSDHPADMEALLEYFEDEKSFTIPSVDRNKLLNYDFDFMPLPGASVPKMLVVLSGGCKIRFNFSHLGMRSGTLMQNESLFIGSKRSPFVCSGNENSPRMNNYDPCVSGDIAFQVSSDQAYIYIPIAITTSSDDVLVIGQAEINCSECNYSCTPLSTSSPTNKVNPYAFGIKGNWHTTKNYTFMGMRNRNLSNDRTDIRNDGYFKSWNPFWDFDATSGNVLKKNFASGTQVENWVWPAAVTLIDNKGNVLEERDSLNRYSSAIFSYNNNFNTAVASNSRYQSIANDHFEDYAFDNDGTANRCFSDHFSYRDEEESNANVEITSADAHSGLASLLIKASESASVSRDFTNYDYANAIQRDENGNYILSTNDCIKKFSPLADNYIVSAWVKPIYYCQVGADDAALKIHSNDSIFIFTPTGPIIEGWQRITGRFSVGSTQSSIEVELDNQESFDVMYDDVRIHPFNSNMKSFVYNPYTLKLMATLDENNYATYYEYDSEGKLVRIKRETEGGIVTLKENYQALHKQ